MAKKIKETTIRNYALLPEFEDVAKPIQSDEKKEMLSPLTCIMNSIFKGDEYISNMTAESARQNLFMTLRRLAIRYPIQANIFNDGKCDALSVLKFFSTYLHNGTGVPKWLWTKVDQQKKIDQNEISAADIKLYKKYTLMNDKDFNDYMKFFPEYIIKEVLYYKELYKDYE